MQTIKVKLSNDTLKYLDMMCQEQQVSRSKLIKKSVERFVETTRSLHSPPKKKGVTLADMAGILKVKGKVTNFATRPDSDYFGK